MSEMTPREIVSELDQHIIGQSDAKRAVAIALRNRWRRMQLQEPMRRSLKSKPLNLPKSVMWAKKWTPLFAI